MLHGASEWWESGFSRDRSEGLGTCQDQSHPFWDLSISRPFSCALLCIFAFFFLSLDQFSCPHEHLPVVPANDYGVLTMCQAIEVVFLYWLIYSSRQPVKQDL